MSNGKLFTQMGFMIARVFLASLAMKTDPLLDAGRTTLLLLYRRQRA
jgi:hypothetical protein